MVPRRYTVGHHLLARKAVTAGWNKTPWQWHEAQGKLPLDAEENQLKNQNILNNLKHSIIFNEPLCLKCLSYIFMMYAVIAMHKAKSAKPYKWGKDNTL